MEKDQVQEIEVETDEEDEALEAEALAVLMSRSSMASGKR